MPLCLRAIEMLLSRDNNNKQEPINAIDTVADIASRSNFDSNAGISDMADNSDKEHDLNKQIWAKAVISTNVTDTHLLREQSNQSSFLYNTSTYNDSSNLSSFLYNSSIYNDTSGAINNTLADSITQEGEEESFLSVTQIQVIKVVVLVGVVMVLLLSTSSVLLKTFSRFAGGSQRSDR